LNCAPEYGIRIIQENREALELSAPNLVLENNFGDANLLSGSINTTKVMQNSSRRIERHWSRCKYK